jgi:protein-disulfide isomerase
MHVFKYGYIWLQFKDLVMKSRLLYLVIVLLLSIPLISLAVVKAKKSSDEPKGAVEEVKKTIDDLITGAEETKKDQYDGEASKLLTLQEDDHYLGNKDAKVVVIEYSSTSCPHCAEYHRHTFGTLKRDYIDNGKILYIYRDLPTNYPGLLGAMLAHCSGDEYFNYISTLMDSQALWAYRKDYKESLINIAKLGGFNDEKIKGCFEDKKLEDMLFKRAMSASQKLNITVTPVFIINGKKYDGALTYPQMSKILDGLLNPSPL